MNNIYGIRSDIHGDVAKVKKHIKLLKSGSYLGIFDLGDIEAAYIGKDNSLRFGQDESKEQTMDAIMRNAIDSGTLTNIGRKAINNVLTSAKEMSETLKLYDSYFYRGIAGNGNEAWTKIFSKISSEKEQEILHDIFGSFGLIREAKAEYFSKGVIDSIDDLKEYGKNPESAIIYIPWKASMNSVRKTLDEIKEFDSERIILMSHDYLTKWSLHSSFREDVKPMQNEEQIVTILDEICKSDAIIEGYYGHIGKEFPVAKTRFSHGNKQLTAYHVDEITGNPLKLIL